ncbi:MAG TPA: cyclase family protein [Candidatus Binataceae bacterium]|nr:cyclase family protein [Candidatus Binataceae bacterium]
MGITGGVAAAVALLMLAAVGPARAQGELFNPEKIVSLNENGKVVDLSYTFDASTIYWPTEGGFVHQFEQFGIHQPGGYFYASARFAAAEHGGTHMDAPLHFNRNGMAVDQIPMSYLMGPAAVIDFSARALKDPDAMLTLEEVHAYERTHGQIPSGAIVVARSGWGRYWPDRKQYLGSDKPGDVTHLHFPGFSPEAVKFLLTQRNVVALAIDTASIDPGSSTDFPVHRLWLGANRVAFENLANADKLPFGGATLFCIPLKIAHGTGAPTRIFAILP